MAHLLELKMTKLDFDFLKCTDDLEKSLFIRCVEEGLLEAFTKGKLSGTVHTCIGQELIGVIVCKFLSQQDTIFSNHRGHGHYLSATGDYYGLIAELMGKSFGAAGGIGGSQHLFNKNYFSNGIQGSTVPISAGCAMANKLLTNDGISVSFIGDGTFGQGIVYETLNIASLWDIPLLVVVENNRISQTTDTRQNLAGSIKGRAEAFGVNYFSADTFHLERLNTEVNKCIDFVRKNKRPALIEIQTDRLRSHSKSDDNRAPTLIKEYYARDLLSNFLSLDKGRELYNRYKLIIADAITTIEQRDGQINLSTKSYFFESLEFKPLIDSVTGSRINDQIYSGLKTSLVEDKNVILLGEDIENDNKYNPLPYGGAFKVTRDLSNLFQGRVINTPISEAAIVGIATGLALRSFKPVVEIMFGDFLPLAFDQLINNASKFVEMFGEPLKVPLLVRVPMGARRGYGPTHSQSLEKHFLGIKNLDVFAMNHRIDNGKLIQNLISNIIKPTLLIENKVLYTKFSNEKKIPGFAYSMTTSMYPDVLIEPKGIKPDYIIICYGQMLEEVEKAVSELSYEDEIYCSVVCLCNISNPSITELVQINDQFKGFLIVEEGSDVAGFSSEIISQLVETQKLGSKRAIRMGNRDIIPCSKGAEDKLIPHADQISHRIRMDFSDDQH